MFTTLSEDEKGSARLAEIRLDVVSRLWFMKTDASDQAFGKMVDCIAQWRFQKECAATSGRGQIEQWALGVR